MLRPVRPRRPDRWMGVLCLLLMGTWAGEARGQAFQGRVLEEGEGVPVAEAWVELVDTGGRSVIRTITDDEGAFLVAAPSPGSYRLRASRVGYVYAMSDPVEVATGETAQVFLSLTLRPFVLDSLVLAGERRPGARAPGEEKFNHRAGRQLGGVFLGRTEIMERNPFRLSDVLRTVDGFLGSGSGEIRPLRGEGCLTFLLNDVPLRGMTLDEIPPHDVMGIEAYRTAREVPEELRGQVSNCAAINIWMRGAW